MSKIVQQPNMLKAHSRKRRELKMKDLSTYLAKVAHDFVKTALESEIKDVGADAWKEEGERVLQSLLRSDFVHDSEQSAGDLLKTLKDELENPLAPDEEEIRAHAATVGAVMASSWLQFLALALRTTTELRLDDTLLPAHGEVRAELWEALRRSSNSLVISADEVLAIMRRFATEVIAESAGADLPMRIALDVHRGKRLSYFARQIA